MYTSITHTQLVLNYSKQTYIDSGINMWQMTNVIHSQMVVMTDFSDLYNYDHIWAMGKT